MPQIAIPFPDISPFLFEIPPFDIGGISIGPLGLRWYALAYIAGLILGWRLMLRLAERPALWGGVSPMSRDDADDFLFYAILGVLVGGRMGFVLFYRPDMLADPLSLLRIWEGGMSFHGGFLGICAAVVGTAWGRKISLWALADAVAMVAPIGLFFGRIANFINQELWGRPWDGPWSFIFATDPERLPRHPSQLYQAALEGLLLFVILWLAVNRFGALRRPGMTAGLFMMGYGAFRILGEQFREPDSFAPDLPGFLTMGTLLSAPMAMVGLALVVLALRRPASGSAVAA